MCVIGHNFNDHFADSLVKLLEQTRQSLILLALKPFLCKQRLRVLNELMHTNTLKKNKIRSRYFKVDFDTLPMVGKQKTKKGNQTLN